MAQDLNLTLTSFDVVLKLAERCNLACTYCYYYEQEYDGSKNSAMMTERVRDELPRFLARSVEELNLDQLNIGLHGGEPLLMKKPIVDDLCTRIRAAVGDKVALHFSVQTNGLLIDEEWIALFEKHKIHVGISIDGSREVHDRRRLDFAGRGSYDRAVDGLRLVQAAVADGRLKKAGVLGVIPATGGERALDHLINKLKIKGPSLNFPRGGWDGEHLDEWNREIASHRKLAKYALENLVYPEFHYVRGLTNVLLYLGSDLGAAMNDRFASQRHNIVTISSDGAIFPDDNLLCVDETFTETDLTIFGTSLRSFVEGPVWQAMQEAITTVPAQCGDCEWQRSCRSGDLYNRFSKKDGFSRPSAICETIKVIHEETAEYLVRNKLVTIEELAARLSQQPVVTPDVMLEALTKKKRPTPAATSNASEYHHLPSQ